MSKEFANESPFGEIALCLSGGGYRAAAFHLGVLSMFDDLGLLKDVKYLSTVSGGTIIGAYFVNQTLAGKDFPAIFKDFYNLLKDNDVISKALTGLDKSNDKKESLSLIRLAAKVYATNFFADKSPTLDELRQKNNAKNGRFKDLIFNATEFKMGNSFRFRVSKSTDVITGNNYFTVKKCIAKDILLADIVAASSCFPGAFEPLCFPEDFSWKKDTPTCKEVFEQYKTRDRAGNEVDTGDKFKVSVPLMDGGIFDNRGLYGITLADDSATRRGEKIGLMLVSDTDRRDEDMLSIESAKKGWLDWIKIGYLWWIALVFVLLSLVSGVALLWSFISHWQANSLSWVDIFIVSASVLLLLTASVLIFVYFNYLRPNKTFEISKTMKIEVWKYVKDLSVSELIELMKTRIKSSLALITDIFMKRSRDLSYLIFRGDGRDGRTTRCLIYGLTPPLPKFYKAAATSEITKEDKKDEAQKKARLEMPKNLLPNEVMKNLSFAAQAMSTTLWIDKEFSADLTIKEDMSTEQKERIETIRKVVGKLFGANDGEKQLSATIICGQLTVCSALINFLYFKRKDERKDENSPESKAFRKLEARWEKLKENPDEIWKKYGNPSNPNV